MLDWYSIMDNLKSIALLWCDLATSFNVPARDVDTFLTRTRCEGERFLYDDLTLLGRAVNLTLTSGKPLIVEGRFRLKRGTKLPLFLGALFQRVFLNDGTLRTDVEPQYIKQLRQLTLLCYKLEVPYGNDTVDEAIRSFVDRDRSLVAPLWESTTCVAIAQRARQLLHRVLQQCSPQDIRPRHGPGATSCGTRNCDKYHEIPRFIEALNNVFEYSEYFFHSTTHLCDKLDAYLGAEVLEVPCSKLVAVPKDRRGPRLICCEPREHQFIQQGLMRALYKCVEQHELTKGLVNFYDSEANRDLARLGSECSNTYSTIDLKDASDRVRWDLVRYLFPKNWVEALDACRTAYVELPDGSVMGPLRKFAPMGSAVCFPVEALVFWALLTAALNINVRFSRFFNTARRQQDADDVDVYVYGDDIIVPSNQYELAVQTLESFDLKVNVDKSCHNTPFRESCGGDYYCGYDVSYVKLRTEIRDTIDSEVSCVEFANLICEHYGEAVARRVRVTVDNAFSSIHPVGPHASGFIYKGEPAAYTDVLFRRRWDRDFQRYEYLLPACCASRERLRDDPQFHWGELFRSAIIGDFEHFKLGEYATPGCTKKYRWRSLEFSRDIDDPGLRPRDRRLVKRSQRSPAHML